MGQTCSDARASKRSFAVNQRDFQVDESERLVLPRPSPFPLGIIYPLSGEYHEEDSSWKDVIEAAKSGYHVIAILRPTISDLPEYAIALTETYKEAVRRLTNAGVICIGHINTARSSKTMWDVEAELSAFASWREHDDRIGLSGIFLDYSSCDDADYAETYYQRAAQLTREILGPLVVFGARGIPRSLKYKDCADIIVTFHNDYAVFSTPRKSDQENAAVCGPLPGTLTSVHPLACVVTSVGKARTHNPDYAAYQAEVKRIASKDGGKDPAKTEAEGDHADETSENKGFTLSTMCRGNSEKLIDEGDVDSSTTTTSTNQPQPLASPHARKSAPSIEAVAKFLYTPLPENEVISRTLNAVSLAKRRGFGWVCMLKDEEKLKRQHDSVVWTSMLYGIHRIEPEHEADVAAQEKRDIDAIAAKLHGTSPASEAVVGGKSDQVATNAGTVTANDRAAAVKQEKEESPVMVISSVEEE